MNKNKIFKSLFHADSKFRHNILLFKQQEAKKAEAPIAKKRLCL